MKNEKAATYTPGPWRIGDARHTVFGPPNAGHAPEIIVTGRRPGNVRLCAAAPELLAALESVVLRMDAKGGPTAEERNYAVIMARAAIAKAKGE